MTSAIDDKRNRKEIVFMGEHRREQKSVVRVSRLLLKYCTAYCESKQSVV